MIRAIQLMPDLEFTQHARDMLIERSIDEAWVRSAIDAPMKQWKDDNGNRHYARSIQDRNNRILHVVVNETRQSQRVITVFFDRKLTRELGTRNET